MEDKIISHNYLLSEVLPLSPEIEIKDDWGCPDSSDFDWIYTKDPDWGYVKVEFAARMTHSILDVETYASNESFMSDYCRFAQLVLSLPPIEVVNLDFDLGIEYDNSGSSDGARYLFILYADSTLWGNLMMKKNSKVVPSVERLQFRGSR